MNINDPGVLWAIGIGAWGFALTTFVGLLRRYGMQPRHVAHDPTQTMAENVRHLIVTKGQQTALRLILELPHTHAGPVPVWALERGTKGTEHPRFMRLEGSHVWRFVDGSFLIEVFYEERMYLTYRGDEVGIHLALAEVTNLPGYVAPSREARQKMVADMRNHYAEVFSA